MRLIQIDPMLVTDEEFKKLRQICYWVNRKPNTLIYALEVDGDIKSVANLKDFGTEISTVKEFDFGTKVGEMGKHYATNCLKMISEDLKNKPEISRIIAQSFHPATEKIVSKLFQNTDGMGTWEKENPYFEEKYQHLCDQIKEGNVTEEYLLKTCSYDLYMEECAKKLLKTHKENHISKEKTNITIEELIARRNRSL